MTPLSATPGHIGSEARPAWSKALILLAVLLTPPIIGAFLQATGVPVFWPLYAISLLVLPVLFFALWAQPLVLVTATLAWFALHKLLIALLALWLQPSTAAWLQNYKEGMYLALFGVGVAAAGLRLLPFRSSAHVMRRLVAPDALAVAFLVLVTIYFAAALAFDPDRLEAALVYGRRFASLPIIFLAGRLLVADRAQLSTAVRYVVIIGVVVAAFGLIERLVLGDRFWVDVVQVDVARSSLEAEGFESDRARLLDGVPANWWSFFDGFRIRRLVSTFLEPTTLALFLALAFSLGLFAVVEWRSRRLFWAAMLALVAIALFLTIGKGGLLAATVTATVVLARTSRHTAWRIATVVLGVVLAALLLGLVLPLGTNIGRHLAGLATGIGHALAQPIGTGLGTTGFWGVQGRVGTDSTIAAIASQVGLLGAALYAAWLATAAWKLLPTAYRGSPGDRLRRVLAGGVFALLVVGVLSNSASGLLGGSWYVLFAGWTISCYRVATEPADPARP